MTKLKAFLPLVVLALALALGGLGRAQAQGTATISISTSSGPVGTVVTVNGFGFTTTSGPSTTPPPETGITVKYDTTTIASGVTATGGGAIGPFTFTIPFSQDTSHSFSATRSAGNVNSASFTLLKPAITLNTSSGPPGGSLIVTGSNFAVNETGITVTFAGSSVASGINAGGSGGWSATFPVPSISLASHPVTAYGSISVAGTVPPQNFTVKAGFSTSKTSAPSGTAVAVTGAGFFPGETGITVTYDGATVASNVIANPQGNWTANFNVPASSGGTHTIGAFGASTSAGAAGTVTFTVEPTISLNRTSGPPGASVTVTGSGFGANESNISITYDGSTVVSGLRADSKGTWTGNFIAPQSTAGVHTVSASGSSTSGANVADISFTIGAGISLSRTSGPPGTVITVNGAGFAAGETGIGLTFDGLPVASGISANGQGAWTGTFPVPPSPGGIHTLRASGSSAGGGTSSDTTFTTTAGISLSRTSGTPGLSVTVTGGGFPANERGITLTYDGVVMASNINANAQGAWTTTVTIPASSGGSHAVVATGSAPQSASPEVTFSVGSGLSLSRSSGPPGVSVTIGGSGFSPDERGITLTYDGVPISPGLAANAQGTWTVSLVIPPSPGGVHTFAAASGSQQGGLAPNASYTVVPGLAPSRTSGPPGASLTVNGAGFGAGERGITITFDGAPVASGISANAQGSWTAVVAVPSTTAGAHSIGASGSATQGFVNTDVTFLVAAELTLSRPNASPGTQVTVSGSGFAANETGISLTYEGAPVASGITAGSQGTWTATFAVPPSSAGSHELRAAGSVTQAAGAPSVGLVVVPVISISPNTGNVGMKTDIVGAGFAPNSNLTVSFGAGEVQGGGVTANGSGGFSFSVVVPRVRAGAQSVKITDGTNNEAQVSFTVEGVPPRAPNPLSPKNNERVGIAGGATPTISWSNTQDPSGVTYVLQMDVSPDFPNPFLEKFDLTSPSYALGDGEGLARGRYYWRVRAVDGAYNESPWSEVLIVRSGLIPGWALAFLVVAALAAAGVSGAYGYVYYIRRKTEVIRVGEVAVPTPVPGYFRELGAPEEPPRPQQRALGLPTRLALPGATQRNRPKVLSPQEQGRLRILVDFARSLPLLQVSYDVSWLDELFRGPGGNGLTDEAKELLLQGRLTPRYDPSWQSHPLYMELRSVLDGHPLLQGIDSFIESVNRCAGDAATLLQEIFRDAAVDVPVEAVRQGHWQYVFGVYADSLGWFRGKFLREPSERDYVFKDAVATPEAVQGIAWLQGAEGTPFTGNLLPWVNRSEAQDLMDRHMRLRRNYRASERAKGLVETLAQLEV
ncbi:MAG TPA: IPT/TIG domain-containing protein, partial [Dehalococcoidia bacterium]|nr:IPT/TIG domain-containing protein [Dehalococcoidia bacterium]